MYSKRSISIFLCALVLAFLPACSWLKGSKAPPPPTQLQCDGFPSQVSSIWNDSVMEDLQLTLRVYKGELDAAGAERIVAMATRFSGSWVSQRKGACDQQNGPNRISDMEYKATVDCLDRALGIFQASTEAFQNGQVQAFESIQSALDDCI